MTEWISVKERLPTEKGWYYVRTFGKSDYFSAPTPKIEFLLYDGKGIGDVTHWLPSSFLPEPPTSD